MVQHGWYLCCLEVMYSEVYYCIYHSFYLFIFGFRNYLSTIDDIRRGDVSDRFIIMVPTMQARTHYHILLHSRIMVSLALFTQTIMIYYDIILIADLENKWKITVVSKEGEFYISEVYS